MFSIPRHKLKLLQGYTDDQQVALTHVQHTAAQAEIAAGLRR